MRSIISITSAVSLMLAQVPTTGFAQTAASPQVPQPVTWSPPRTEAQNAVIAEAFKAFPNGGDALVKRISDLIAGNPKLASDLVRYVRTVPGVTYGQKIAAERGLAAALERLGIVAADMPVKAAPMGVPVAYDYTWLAALAAAAVIGGIVCVAGACRHDHNVVAITGSAPPSSN
jgi:hypothetical protein